MLDVHAENVNHVITLPIENDHPQFIILEPRDIDLINQLLASWNVPTVIV